MYKPHRRKLGTSKDQMLFFFDCDGVLVDTEAEGHRIAFNKAFKEKGEVPTDFGSHYNLLQLVHMK